MRPYSRYTSDGSTTDAQIVRPYNRYSSLTSKHIESSAGYVSYGALSYYYSLTNLSSVRSCALVLDDEALCSSLGDYEIGTIAQCGEVYL